LDSPSYIHLYCICIKDSKELINTMAVWPPVHNIHTKFHKIPPSV